jgi:hypothetical protein
LPRTESIVFYSYFNWGVRAGRLMHARACNSHFQLIIYTSVHKKI